MRSLVFAVLVAIAFPAAAAEPDYDAIAKKIDVDSASLNATAAGKPKESCEKKLADGTCPDVVKESRQLRLSGATTTAVTPSAAKMASRATAAQVTPSILNLTFLVGSAELSSAAKAQLDKFAAALGKLKSMSPFYVDGHTDRSGTTAMNMELSRARAQSTVDFLTAQGVAPSRMVARGFGYEQPLPGRSPDSPANRRVEIIAR